MGADYRLSRKAASDIENILDFSVREFGLEKAESYYQSLTQCLRLLSDNPEMGKIEDELRAGYRSFIHESHVIYYMARENDILIVRIFHKRMDYVNRF